MERVTVTLHTGTRVEIDADMVSLYLKRDALVQEQMLIGAAFGPCSNPEKALQNARAIIRINRKMRRTAKVLS